MGGLCHSDGQTCAQRRHHVPPSCALAPLLPHAQCERTGSLRVRTRCPMLPHAARQIRLKSHQWHGVAGPLRLAPAGRAVAWAGGTAPAATPAPVPARLADGPRPAGHLLCRALWEAAAKITPSQTMRESHALCKSARGMCPARGDGSATCPRRGRCRAAAGAGNAVPALQQPQAARPQLTQTLSRQCSLSRRQAQVELSPQHARGRGHALRQQLPQGATAATCTHAHGQHASTNVMHTVTDSQKKPLRGQIMPCKSSADES